VTTPDQPGHAWTVVMRRRPARIVAGRPVGGYTNAFEIICCDCGDHPSLDYDEVSPELQRIRGPYSIATGIAECEKHLELHKGPGTVTGPGPGLDGDFARIETGIPGGSSFLCAIGGRGQRARSVASVCGDAGSPVSPGL
jgi:hypothetical protein